jgi:hypothetical protein
LPKPLWAGFVYYHVLCNIITKKARPNNEVHNNILSDCLSQIESDHSDDAYRDSYPVCDVSPICVLYNRNHIITAI